MLRNECGRSRCSVGATVGKLALITLVVLSVASLAPGAPNKDKDQQEEFTRIYQHTYDEVFQAALDAVERMGLTPTDKDKDKDKGTISGNGVYQQMTGVGPRNFKTTLDIHIETVSAKPETRLTINAHMQGVIGRTWEKTFKQNFLIEVQKVLATYH
jgi:hypothetical protein